MITINISGFSIHIAQISDTDTICYLIFPELAELEDKWIQRMAEELKVSLAAVYVPANQWNDALTPWPEPGEAPGCPPFAGKAKEFLNLLQTAIIPQVEKSMVGIKHRDLLGVSLGGLFTLWQWLECNTFRSIASLSGSFWYKDFIQWFSKQTIPQKSGKAFFLLGEEEPKAHIAAYRSVGENTETIVKILGDHGIKVDFQWVPGNHFSRPVHRAELSLHSLYPAD